MPEAKILVRGKMPGLSVKMQAILGDAWLRAQRVGEYAVWRKPLTFYNPARGLPGQSRGDPQPWSVQCRVRSRRFRFLPFRAQRAPFLRC